ncbi:hypothetical protein DE4576_02270 [Mycobacterium marinum]|nr:hypothetical protein DE4576_02270 [Mycobacterium marinum]
MPPCAWPFDVNRMLGASDSAASAACRFREQVAVAASHPPMKRAQQLAIEVDIAARTGMMGAYADLLPVHTDHIGGRHPTASSAMLNSLV